MRLTPIVAVALLACGDFAFAGPPIGGPDDAPAKKKLIVHTIQHPEYAIQAAIDHLNKQIPPDVRPFVRYFWWGSTPDDRMQEDLTNFLVTINTVSSSNPKIALPSPVAGTSLRLWWADIRDYYWTIAGFSSVAHADRVFTEPNCDSRLAETVRRLIGVQQDPKTFHVEAIVPGPWFTRAIMDPDGTETTAYYDLLYSVERFGFDKGIQPVVPIPLPTVIPPEPVKPIEKPWAGGMWPGDDADKGKYFPPNAFMYTSKSELEAYQKAKALWDEAKASSITRGPKQAALPPGVFVSTKVVKDFPATLKDYQDKWGITANAEFLDKQKIFVNKGEVVAGSKSDPKRGSYVAYQDRVLTFANGEFNNGGIAASTKDFLRTSKQKNPANLPTESALGLLKEDAGEHLTNMPNGLQAALLTNAERKRIDTADGRVAHSALDPRDVVIRTQFSCTICHAKQDGILSPSNKKVGETLRRGIQLHIRGKENQLIVDGFFEDSEWRLELGRVAYKRAVAIASTWGAHRPWTGVEWSEAIVSFRNWYDDPLYSDQAAAELGVSKLVLMIACLKLGSIDAANLFISADGVPRTVFDDDLFTDLALVIAAMRQEEDPDPLLMLFAPELIRQTYDKTAGKTK